MNNIHIEDKIFIEVDESSATVKEYTGKFDKDGKELYNVLGYFQTVQGAVKKLLRLNIARTKINSLNELLERLNGIESKIDEAISKIKFQGVK